MSRDLCLAFINALAAGDPSEHAETRMSIADQVFEQVKTLPEPLAREVLDFVAFLRDRRDRQEWRDHLMAAQTTSLALAWDNVEDGVWDHA